MTDINTIRDRESWLAWRAGWRTRYAEISAEVRSCKNEMRANVRERRATEDEAVHRRIDHSVMPGLQSGRERGRILAREMMEQLEEAKAMKTATLERQVASVPVAA